MLESSIEAGLREQVIKHGGMFLKFTSPGTRGVPDRIIIDNGRVIFVELKQSSGRLSTSQEVVIKRMRRHGADVRVVYGQAGAKALVKDLWPEGVPELYVSTAKDENRWVKSYYSVRAGARGAGRKMAMRELVDLGGKGDGV